MQVQVATTPAAHIKDTGASELRPRVEPLMNPFGDPRPQVEPLINPPGEPRPQVEPGQLQDMEVQPSEEQRLDSLQGQRPLGDPRPQVEPEQLQDLAVQGDDSRKKRVFIKLRTIKKKAFP